MQQTISLKLLPAEAADPAAIRAAIAVSLGKQPNQVTGFYKTKESIDARSSNIYVHLTVQASIDEPPPVRPVAAPRLRQVGDAKHRVIVIGAGPAGLFAALNLMEAGIQPVIVERGKDVRSRRRDLAALNKEGIVNADSNYCFGEGGAGTYSDGKLYTRSNKRGSIDKILGTFVTYGAEEKILYQAHPHIGTNKLPHIITSIRKAIVQHGGLYFFDERVDDLLLHGDKVTGVHTASGNTYKGDAVILATGHSARDVFDLLKRKKIAIESKPFALGVRVEHPQAIINNIQYRRARNHDTSAGQTSYLPPASYSLVHQVNQKGVFSFCMCPGGIIAPAATSPGELVVNGWSPSKRNNPFANSGMVVEVSRQDAFNSLKKGTTIAEEDPLLLMQFQRKVETDCFEAGGGGFVAPAQRLIDFVTHKTSATLPPCSYIPGLSAVNLHQVLPGFVANSLAEAFKAFGKKMPGYYTNDAVLVATESRTSSPVRIPRDPSTLEHVQVKGLYPCAEGAGYAGGIVSAAMDGEKVAKAITAKLGY